MLVFDGGMAIGRWVWECCVRYFWEMDGLRTGYLLGKPGNEESIVFKLALWNDGMGGSGCKR